MRIDKDKSLLLVVDIQEKLFPHMDNKDQLAKKALTLVKGMQALAVPMIAARQYPKGLGDIIQDLQPYLPQHFDKTTFSCCGEPALLANVKEADRKNIIIAGIEAHICVLQTVIDIKAEGLVPVVVADAVASRQKLDYEMALRRMEQAGAVLTTVESILFELCLQAGTPEFKTISQLVK